MIDKLRQAINSKDWDYVVEFYEILSGLHFSFDEPEPELPKKPKARKSRTTKADLDTSEVLPTPKSTKVTDLDFSMRKTNKRSMLKKTEPVPVKTNRTNKFESQKTDLPEEEILGYDAVDDNVKPVNRSRTPYKAKDVNCIGCKKTFSLHPTLVRKPYRCDNCITKMKDEDGID